MEWIIVFKGQHTEERAFRYTRRKPFPRHARLQFFLSDTLVVKIILLDPLALLNLSFPFRPSQNKNKDILSIPWISGLFMSTLTK